MFDLDHWPKRKGSTGGRDWPVQLTHCCIASVGEAPEDWRIAAGVEYFGALGFHVHGHLANSFGVSKHLKYLAALPICQQKLLAGNAMHLATQSAWMVYVLSNVAKVSRLHS